MGDDADLWEMLTKSGIRPDSATAIVQSHRGMGDADLWERLTKNGASHSAATQIVQSRNSSPDDTNLSLRNVGRSVTQGATFGFGDEMGLTDRAKENAFKAEHPIVDMIAKMAGGVPAAIGATMAAPVLGTTLGGAAALGGGIGLLGGAGDAEGDATDRLESGVKGGLLGVGGGMLGYGASKLIGSGWSALMDRMHPERAVARSAARLIDDPAAVTATMDEMNKLAPGSASVATSTIARDGTDQSRFLQMVRGTGASPAGSRATEAQIVAQRAAIDAGKRALGSQMDALHTSDIPITPAVRDAMDVVRPVLGGKSPTMPPPPLNMHGAVPPTGLQTPAMSAFGANPVIQNPAATTMSLEEARDALSRLRYLSRQQEILGVSANGVTKHDVNVARRALQDVVYAHRPDFAPLDQQYAKLMDHEGATEDLLTQVQRSRSSHGANEAYGSTSGSLGGSLPRGAHGITMDLLDRMFTNKAGAADAVARLIAKPGGPEMVQGLLSQVPKASGLPKYGAPIMAATIPGMRGLLSPTSP